MTWSLPDTYHLAGTGRGTDLGNPARQPVRLGRTAVLLVGVAHGGPLPTSDDLVVARHLPLGRHWAGDRSRQPRPAASQAGQDGGPSGRCCSRRSPSYVG